MYKLQTALPKSFTHRKKSKRLCRLEHFIQEIRQLFKHQARYCNFSFSKAFYSTNLSVASLITAGNYYRPTTLDTRTFFATYPHGTASQADHQGLLSTSPPHQYYKHTRFCVGHKAKHSVGRDSEWEREWEQRNDQAREEQLGD